MLIEGPLKIGVLDDPEQPGRELHIDFTTEFQMLGQQDQSETFTRYLGDLQQGIVSLPEDDPNRAGMLVVQQITEQLLPHVANGDLELSDTIIVEMGRDHSSDSLMSLLNS
ncbi:MAG: transcriptional regulator [Candidatus Thiodiazotropha sp. (ex Myrtea spinifera)]|nr:transcriptional regulator [Candidatus Thiodiazotropha sp. (ex Myrtea spinifera)]MCU7829898.1 transcriptional regulator [Candidatus Thiodiazotropha sp. (ex Myrtea sp. 'scaly one' KF741663)]